MHLPEFKLNSRVRRSKAGSTLAATMMVVAAIVSFLSIAALITSQFGRYAGRQRGNTDTVTACDAALEYAYAQWKTEVYNAGQIPTAAQCTAPNMATNFNNVYAGTGGFAKSGVSCTTLTIQAADQNGQNLTNGKPTGTKTQNVPGYPGWSGTTYNYVATATVTNANHYGATVNDANGVSHSSVTAQRFFQLTSVPLFQAAIFYENKLEIHPGDAMTVTGLVHTNGDLWAQGFSTLQFLSNVSYVGAFHQAADTSVTYGWDGYGLKYFPAATQQITWANGQSYSSPAGSTTQLNQVTPIDPFGNDNTANNGLHAIIEVPPNGVTAKEYAYNSAGLIITVNTTLQNTAAGRYTIKDGSGNALTGADYNNVLAAIGGTVANNGTSTTSTIIDMREASTVTLTNLDMNLLAKATSPPGPADAFQTQFANKPTVYIQDVGATTSSTRRSIRLINGRNLGQSVSVVSNNAVYIQGDYNTGGTKPSDVPANTSSNTNGTASNVATGYTAYTSSVMADAVMVLSNNWNDANSSNQLAGVWGGNSTTGRVATPTTVNTAILAGDVPSNLNNNGIASGGAHNFPRFLEDWTNQNFTYYGSLVEAFRSTKYTGLWQTANVYAWPKRWWFFDTNFVNNPPPGATTSSQFSRGRYLRVEN